MSGQGFDDLGWCCTCNSFSSKGKIPEVWCEKEFTRKNNIYFKGLGGCIGCNRSQSNRPVSWIKRKVNSSMFLFKSLERSWLPYNKSWVKASFERSVICTNDRNNSATLREDPVVEHQMKGRATNSAPYPQSHHLLGTLGLWHPYNCAWICGSLICWDQPSVE